LYDARSAALNSKHTGGTGTSSSFTKRGLPIYEAETPLELENKSGAGIAGSRRGHLANFPLTGFPSTNCASCHRVCD